MTEAHHRTVINTPFGPACIVSETCEDVMQRVRVALQSNQGWFEVTADPEGETIWVNAHLIVQVGRERTPLEHMKAQFA